MNVVHAKVLQIPTNMEKESCFIKGASAVGLHPKADALTACTCRSMAILSCRADSVLRANAGKREKAQAHWFAAFLIILNELTAQYGNAGDKVTVARNCQTAQKLMLD